MKLALIQPAQIQSWEQGEIERIAGLLRAAPFELGFELVSSARDADLVVLLESCTFKTRHDIPMYRALLQEHGPERLCCINYEDGPPGFLPGLYSSLESYRFDPELHRSWPHLKLPNERIDETDASTRDAAPLLLFTFSGACSHPLRRALFDKFESRPGRHKVREIKRWYDHNDAERMQYVVDIAQSKFVLCPRGIASYSHRILETLALGRVPVVIADDWVPFSIPEAGYFVRLAECRIDDLEAILGGEESRYDVLSARAREVYQKNFRPDVRYVVALQQLAALSRAKSSCLGQAELKDRWNSRSFWKSNDWCLEQRVVRRLRKLVAA